MDTGKVSFFGENISFNPKNVYGVGRLFFLIEIVEIFNIVGILPKLTQIYCDKLTFIEIAVLFLK